MFTKLRKENVGARGNIMRKGIMFDYITPESIHISPLIQPRSFSRCLNQQPINLQPSKSHSLIALSIFNFYLPIHRSIVHPPMQTWLQHFKSESTSMHFHSFRIKFPTFDLPRFSSTNVCFLLAPTLIIHCFPHICQCFHSCILGAQQNA